MDLNKITNDMLEAHKKAIAPLEDKIAKKEAKIARENEILENHKHQLKEKEEAYENEVKSLITKLILDEGASAGEAKSVYKYLMFESPLNVEDTNITTSHSAQPSADDVADEYPPRY